MATERLNAPVSTSTKVFQGPTAVQSLTSVESSTRTTSNSSTDNIQNPTTAQPFISADDCNTFCCVASIESVDCEINVDDSTNAGCITNAQSLERATFVYSVSNAQDPTVTTAEPVTTVENVASVAQFPTTVKSLTSVASSAISVDSLDINVQSPSVDNCSQQMTNVETLVTADAATTAIANSRSPTDVAAISTHESKTLSYNTYPTGII